MKKEQISTQFYEVKPHTMIIFPKKSGSIVYSEIYEVDSHHTSKFTPFELIKTSCNFFGSSYEGRKEGTKHLIGVTHKPPIIIDPVTSTYVFPTVAPSSTECIWIFPQHIKDYHAIGFNHTLITFSNMETFEIDMSLASFNNQIARTSMLHMKFSQKMRIMESNFPSMNRFFPPTTLAAEPRRYYSTMLPNNEDPNEPQDPEQ
ncbi:competence protein [Listeria monocytogenes]|uniref:competence protein ComK n=1 Tax=Listeria monocytogenes TaxID=1639 RepID=UPI0013665DAD|nr:competence protein ComK [Listeria monocytogenes]MWA70405.1 competence protein [Listeria monocytogenes]